jgi:hypothetical protein
MTKNTDTEIRHEVMDIANGLIAHHRVHWGWVGFKVLVGNTRAS